MSEHDAPFHCYPCARGDHDEHKMNAWEPGIPCECPPCAIPYQHGPHIVDDGRTQDQCPGVHAGREGER